MFEEDVTRRQRSLWLLGLLYGLLLSVIGVLAANAGHGTYILMGVFSAPFGFLGIPVAILGSTILWLLVGLSFGKGKKVFLLLILIHYVGVFMLSYTETFGDWKYFYQLIEHNPTLILLGLMIYVVGQIAMWRRFAMTEKEIVEE